MTLRTLKTGLIGATAICSTGMAAPQQAAFEGLDPLQWAREPHATLSHTATMAAATVEAPGGVEYRFECLDVGAASSKWQADPEYRATGLTPATVYTFVAKVRSKAEGRELLAPSRAVAVTTPPADKHDARLAAEVELVPLLVSGDKDNRISIVIVNRWTLPKRENDYNNAGLREEFLEDARHVLRGLTRGDDEALEPFVTLRNFFNVYALWWPTAPPWNPNDRQNGLHWEDYNALRDRLFLPWQRDGRGWVTHLAMLNSDGGGGGAGRRPESRVGDAMIAGNEIRDFFHEFSHTAMGLGDKYIGWGVWGGASASDESFVATHWTQRDRVRWQAWIEPDTPVPTPYDREHLHKVGVFEGATHRLGYVFRATPTCIMGVSQFRSGLCPVCIQRAVQRTYQWVDVFDATTPVRRELTLKQPGRARFAVTRVKPDPDTQRVQWRVNGKLVATQVDEIEVDLGALPAYEISCTVTDETALIRPDPPYSAYPRAETSWHVTNPPPVSPVQPLRVGVATTDADCWGRDNGALVASVTHGKAPYTYRWCRGPLRAPTGQPFRPCAGVELPQAGPRAVGLPPGQYHVHVFDSEFRTATAQATVRRPVSLAAKVRTQRRGDRWTVALTVTGGDEKVTCKWSTGASGLVLEGVPDGHYRYQLTHESRAVLRGDVTLVKPEQPLEATVVDIVPATDENDGQIRLKVSGGRAPYRFIWSDSHDASGGERRFLAPGEYTVTVQDANLTAVEQTVTVGKAEPFVLARPQFEATSEGAVRIANPSPALRYLWYDRDRPLFLMRPPRGLYVGTFTSSTGQVVEATGEVIPATNGKWITETKEHRNDFSTWVRLDAYVDGPESLPKTVKLPTDHDGRPGATLRLTGDTTTDEWLKKDDETFLHAVWEGAIAEGRLTLSGKGPDGGRFELFYSSFRENPATPLHVGVTFRPPKSGNYYVAAQQKDTGALSWNRVGVALSKGPQPPVVEPLQPDEVKSGKLLLWLDASDLNADGEEDTEADFWTWERGIVHGWKGRANDVGFRIMHYLPNAANGKPVCDFRYLWLQQTTQPVQGFQTAFMVYREHDLSEPGTGPWQEAPICFWDLREEAQALDRLPAEYRQARAFLNGQPVDPFATPAPLDRFCLATFELPEATGHLHRTDTRWEGSFGELVVYEGKLSAAERKGVEEYLRRKWLSEVRLLQ